MKLLASILTFVFVATSGRAEVVVWGGPGKIVQKDSAKTTSTKILGNVVSDAATFQSQLVIAVVTPTGKVVGKTPIASVGKVETKTGKKSSLLLISTTNQFTDATDFQSTIARFSGVLANLPLHAENSQTSSLPALLTGSLLAADENKTIETSLVARFNKSSTQYCNTNNLDLAAATQAVVDYYVSKGYTPVN